MLEKLKKHNIIFMLVAVVLGLPAVFAFLGTGFPQTDDGNWMVIRFSAFYEALRNGQIPVRFLLRLNNGFGYPVADFLYPLFMYLGVPVHLLGFNFTSTIKILFASSIIFSSVFTFLWLRKLFDNLSSLVGSVFYTLFPYHLFDIYKRGSVGEALSFPILSFTLWQIERRSIFWLSIGIFLLILSHNTLALFFLPLILLYGYYRKRIKKVLYSILFGLLMSSFFWLPALYDLQYTVFSKTKISDLNSYFSDNLTISLLGISFLFLLLELVFSYIRTKRVKLFYSLLFLIFISFFLFSVSKAFWGILPLTSVIQFPFRIISVLIPISAFLTAWLVNQEKKNKKYVVCVIYLVFTVIAAIPFMSPKVLQYFPDSYYSTNLDTTTVKDEYMPKWVTNKPEFSLEKVKLVNGQEKVNLEMFTDRKISFNTRLNKKSLVKVNVVYFPGWEATVNGAHAVINYSDNGIIGLNLNKGNNSVILEYKEEGIRLWADILSIIGLLSLLIFTYKNKNENS